MSGVRDLHIHSPSTSFPLRESFYWYQQYLTHIQLASTYKVSLSPLPLKPQSETGPVAEANRSSTYCHVMHSAPMEGCNEGGERDDVGFMTAVELWSCLLKMVFFYQNTYFLSSAYCFFLWGACFWWDYWFWPQEICHIPEESGFKHTHRLRMNDAALCVWEVARCRRLVCMWCYLFYSGTKPSPGEERTVSGDGFVLARINVCSTTASGTSHICDSHLERRTHV